MEVWPLLRDSGTYIFVVGLLAIILADGVVMWYEALILVILYFVYFILMFTQKRIKTAANKILTSKNSFSCKYTLWDRRMRKTYAEITANLVESNYQTNMCVS